MSPVFDGATLIERNSLSMTRGSAGSRPSAVATGAATTLLEATAASVSRFALPSMTWPVSVLTPDAGGGTSTCASDS